MKLCVVGNSHIGMLRAGLPDLPDAEVTFFALPPGRRDMDGSTLAETDPKRRRRLAGFGMPDRVDLAAFDAVVFAGTTIGMRDGLRATHGVSVPGWPSGQKAADALLARSGGPLEYPFLSQSALAAMFETETRQTISYGLAQSLRAVAPVAIIVLPPPMPAAHILDMGGPYGYRARKVLNRGDGRALARSVSAARARAFCDIETLLVIEQPPDTIERDILTAPDFSRGAIRVDGVRQHGEDDPLHGNAALGARLMSLIFEAAAEMSESLNFK